MPRMPSIPQELNNLFPAPWLRRTARECGAVKRKRKVDIVALFWTLIMANKTGAFSSLAALQLFFHVASSTNIVRSAFFGRFSKELVAFLKICLARAISVTIEPMATPALFRAFSDVWVQDSTIITLADAVAAIFPGPRKINVVYSVISGSLKRITIASGTKSETKFLKIDREISGVLLLADLGFYKYDSFSRIDQHGGFFISRMRKYCNPRIVVDHHRGAGRTRDLVGMKLKDAVKGLGRNRLDVEVEVFFTKKRRQSRNNARKSILCRRRFRLVGIRHPESGELHLYLTNVSIDLMTPEQIRAAYTARWAVELVIKELKSCCQMRKFPSAKPNAIRALILCSAIRLMVSRVALYCLRQRIMTSCRQNHSDGDFVAYFERLLVSRTGYMRFAVAWNSFSLMLLPELFREAGLDWDTSNLELMLFAAAFDPNVQSDSLFHRLAVA